MSPGVEKARNQAFRFLGSKPVAFMVGVIGLVAFAVGITLAAVAYIVKPERGDEPKLVTRGMPSVITSIRDLARLETTSYHIERVIDLKHEEKHFFGMMKTEDAILLVAAGDVTAGVDLTALREGDVVVQPEQRHVQIRLPPPQILHVTIDNKHTYVHSRRTDLLARRHEDLESKAREHAEGMMEKAAIESGILDRARRNAAQTLRTLVRGLGYEVVEIHWQDQEGASLRAVGQ